MQKLEDPDPAGRRERKRTAVRDRVQEEAIRLFLARGFDATTLDDIAAAADVSRRSLFHYFASKEDIVTAGKGDFPALVEEAVARRPADEPLLDMVEGALRDVGERYLSARTRDLARLIQETPALRAGEQAKYEALEVVLASALAERKRLPDTDLSCRVIAVTAVGILKLTAQAWLTDDGVGPSAFGKAAFAALRRVAGSPVP